MDNFRIDLTAEGDGLLARAVGLAFEGSGHPHACGYAVRPARDEVASGPAGRPLRMIFYWVAPQAADYVPFPFSMGPAAAADFVRAWLAEADYGREPDHDGDNERGWRVWCDGWGQVDGEYQAFLAVSPAWACYGK